MSSRLRAFAIQFAAVLVLAAPGFADELDRLLSEVDELRSVGKHEDVIVADVEAQCDLLKSRFPDPADQARIAYQRAFTIGQACFSTHKALVRNHAIQALEISKIPQHRLRLFVYVGDASIADIKLGALETRRRLAGAAYLRGYQESLMHDVPDEGVGDRIEQIKKFIAEKLPHEGPERPNPEWLTGLQPYGVENYYLIHKYQQEWTAVSEQNEILNQIAMHRQTLAKQLVYIYSMSPEDPAGFRQLAAQYLRDSPRVEEIANRIELAVESRGAQINARRAPGEPRISPPSR